MHVEERFLARLVYVVSPLEVLGAAPGPEGPDRTKVVTKRRTGNMRKSRKRLIGLACLLVAVFMGSLVWAAENDQITVVGVLALDAEGGPILQAGGKVYLLEGGQFDDLIGKKVKATGQVEQTEDGAIFLIVENVEPTP